MGGSGRSSGYIGPLTKSEQEKLQKAQELERLQLMTDINRLINDALAVFNGRDRDATNEKLDKLQDLLGSDFEVEHILLGGSVAKHTEVDGLSDVDALVVLDKEDIERDSPKKILSTFYKTLNEKLEHHDVAKIEKGNLAVTITFDDDTQIQLLPALRSKTHVFISSPDGTYWNETKPKAFTDELTAANKAMNNALVPAIKLMKAVNSNLPPQKQLTGYHIEAIAVDSVKTYDGEKTSRALLLHMLGYAAERVLVPIKDKTGQSRVVDSYLGKADSVQRKNVSQAMSGLQRRLDTATTLQQWKSVLGVADE